MLVFLGFVFALYREGMTGAVLIAGFAAIVMAVLTILTSASTMDYPLLGERTGFTAFMVGFVLVGAVVIRILRSATLPRYRARTVRLAIGVMVAAVAYSTTLNVALEDVLRPHQKERIHVLFGLEVSNPDADYNIRHAKTAIGSGGLAGRAGDRDP